MKYSAILSDTYPTNLSKEHLGWIVEGIISQDTATHGNHPIPDGYYITTSRLVDVVEEDGNKYLITNSTTYLLKED